MVVKAFRLWCPKCAEWFRVPAEEETTEFECGQCHEELVDVSDKQYMVVGYPIAEGAGATTGHHVFHLTPRVGKRWLEYTTWIRFSSELLFDPIRIELSHIETDGTAGLKVLEATRKGFKISVFNKGRRGLSSVEFDWEAVR